MTNLAKIWFRQQWFFLPFHSLLLTSNVYIYINQLSLLWSRKILIREWCASGPSFFIASQGFVLAQTDLLIPLVQILGSAIQNIPWLEWREEEEELYIPLFSFSVCAKSGSNKTFSNWTHWTPDIVELPGYHTLKLPNSKTWEVWDNFCDHDCETPMFFLAAMPPASLLIFPAPSLSLHDILGKSWVSFEGLWTTLIRLDMAYRVSIRYFKKSA